MMQIKYLNKPVAPILLIHAHYTIGRSSVCDIQLNDNSLLNIHTHLHFNANTNALFLVQEGGGAVTVNSQPVSGEVQLVHGDNIVLGEYKFIVEDSKMHLEQPLDGWTLYNEAGDLAVNEFTIRISSILGRGSKCDIAIDKGTELSRRHAKLSVVGSELIVEDLGSSNGTFINGIKIQKAALVHDDEVRFADIKFRVRDPFFDKDDEKTSFLSLADLNLKMADISADKKDTPSAIERQLQAAKSPDSTKFSASPIMDADDESAHIKRAAKKTSTFFIAFLVTLLVLGVIAWLR